MLKTKLTAIVITIIHPLLHHIHGLQFIKKVPTIHKNKFDEHQHYWHTHQSTGSQYETPVLVRDALPPEKCELMTAKIVDKLGSKVVEMQHRQKIRSKLVTKTCPINLERAFGYMMASHHESAFFCFCEGLLCDENDNMKDVQRVLQEAKESLFNDNDDLFHYFPENVKPTDCLILAGEGATSTLHRDPFCWTGTSLCLEGTKVWRFIAPPGHSPRYEGMKCSGVQYIDKALKSYRLDSMAWDDRCISSGWQSDASLYFKRSANVPSAKELSMLQESHPKQKIKDLKNIASNLDALTPSANFPTRIRLDLKKSESHEVDLWSVVQNPGDLLIIPAFWWHQTYALEPSLAVASQRCGMMGGRDVKRVLEHVLENRGLLLDGNDRNRLPQVLKNVLGDSFHGSGEEVAESLFEFLSEN